MRFLSLYIVFVSFSLALLLSGGVQGIPVSVSNPNAPPRHAEVHKRDLISTILSLLTSILGSLNIPVAAVQPAQAAIDRIQNLTAGLPLPALPIPALPIPRGAVEAVGVGSPYSSSSTVQANSTASPSNALASPYQASASAAHQQADVHPGRGRHIHRRDTTSASALSSSGSAHVSSTSTSGSVRASSDSASGKPALDVLPTLPVLLPIPNPSLPVSLPIHPSLPVSLPIHPSLPVSLPIPDPSLPVSAPIPNPSLPVSPPISAPILAASSGTTKGKRTHHR